MTEKLKKDSYSIGPNLCRLRKKHGYSQEMLCRELQLRGYPNIYRSLYAKYESGTNNTPIALLVYLTKLYGCSYDDFFEGLRPDDSRL